MIGICAYGGYVPRLRLSREAVGLANAWYAPQAARQTGTRAMGNWDEDSITMAVAAARDCLGPTADRSRVGGLLLASDTLPFAERLNAGIVAGALALKESVHAADLTGTPRVGVSALAQALARVRGGEAATLVVAADQRKARAASTQELAYGDAAAALLVGSEAVLAEWLGAASTTVDFIDHFRASGRDFDYHWEERWIRDEGVSRLLPEVIARALEHAGVQAGDIDHFIFPSTIARLASQVAAQSGLRADSLADALDESVGDSGAAHALLMLSHVLEQARPGQHVLVAQFGSGAEALVFRVTELIESFRPARGVGAWIERGVVERNYTKFLAFRGLLELERGMRAEQDRKTALSTAWRHRAALLGLIAGRCRITGSVHFPPTRLSHDRGRPALDTQEPYALADRAARVLSWSAQYLSWHPSPPHHYGQIDFEGGGRMLMDFTDIEVGDVDVGTAVDMVFRVKDVDERRGFTRYFWKATPVRGDRPGG